ncbi:tctex1 domain-containing protein 1, partial [Oxyura jamaicensis]|uniref:tctex1 domain-containing protein 1 n=1 Tax=Oxyura jamaicensis TaxID=8884 RepID=UPI0015A6E550
PGGSGTEPRCPPASSRRPSTASRPGEAQRAGEERGGGAGGGPLTGPAKRFPVGAVDAILRDVLRGYLQEQPYEPGVCGEMAKSIAEVIKARVKDLLVPRYKIVVVTHIGQLNEQSMQIGSRCLWDPATDTFSSYVFRNTSLFALANVYAIYFE